jgi:hypothetical protein
MNDLLDLPAERDLPPAAATRIRAEFLRTVTPPPRRRWALAAAGGLALAAVVVAGVVDRDQPPSGPLVALGPTGLPPALDEIVELCANAAGTGEHPYPFRVSEADAAVATLTRSHAALLFLTEDAYMTCDRNPLVGGPGFSVSVGFDRWREQRDWLPGPVHQMSGSSTEVDGGEVTASGRVSPRVARLTLEWGAGRSVDAEVADGIFGLVTDTADVTGDAALVAYDASGTQIARRPLFRALYDFDRCYTDPDGRVVYRPIDGCGTGYAPAERWGR